MRRIMIPFQNLSSFKDQLHSVSFIEIRVVSKTECLVIDKRVSGFFKKVVARELIGVIERRLFNKNYKVDWYFDSLSIEEIMLLLNITQNAQYIELEGGAMEDGRQ